MRFLFRLPAFLLLAVLAGCAATSRNIPDLDNVTSAQIQSKVLRNFGELKSLEGRARVIIELPGEGYSGSSKIYIKFPDSVFVKTEAILGIDVGALFLDSRYFAAYAPRENILYYGEVETLDLREFLQIEIETDELVEVFAGLTQVTDDSTATLTFEDGEYLISQQLGDKTLKCWVDPKNYVVTKSHLLNAAGEVILSKEYRRFRKKKGVMLPQIIKITRPLARERLTIYYTSQKVNKSIAPEKFRLKTSQNAKKVYWGGVRLRTDRKRNDKAN